MCAFFPNIILLTQCRWHGFQLLDRVHDFQQLSNFLKGDKKYKKKTTTTNFRWFLLLFFIGFEFSCVFFYLWIYFLILCIIHYWVLFLIIHCTRFTINLILTQQRTNHIKFITLLFKMIKFGFQWQRKLIIFFACCVSIFIKVFIDLKSENKWMYSTGCSNN